MFQEQEIRQWIDELQAGNPQAIEQLWRQYADRLQRAARRRLGDLPRRVFDEEDVAQSAFHSFCRGVMGGRFPALDSQDDLWRLLVTITARKAAAQFKRHLAKKRGGGDVRGESVFQPAGDGPGFALGDVLGPDASPAVQAILDEDCERLLAALPDDDLRRLAIWKLEGHTNEEIAELCGCTTRTVERRLRSIRQTWERDDADGELTNP